MERTDRTLRLILLSLWIAIAVGLTGILVYGISSGGSFWSGIRGMVFYKGGESVLLKEESLPIGGISSLVFQTEEDSVLITQSADDQMHIRQYGMADDETLKYTLDKTADKITVTRKNRRFPFFNFSFGFSNPRLEIEVPAGYAGNLTVKTVSGEMGLGGDWKLGEIKFSSTSGDLSVTGIVSGSGFSASTVSGELWVNDITAEDLSFSSTSGDLMAERLAGSGKASTVSGEVMIKALEGALDVNTTSGDVSIKDFNPIGSMSIGTVSGYVGIGLVPGAEATFAAKSVSGDIDSDVGVISGKKAGDADIVISTTSGDIRIRQ